LGQSIAQACRFDALDTQTDLETRPMKFPHSLIACALLGAATAAMAAGPLENTECIAPAKPGGGFDLTCKLAQSALMETKTVADPMRITYMPGGIGAVAYNTIVAQRPAEANTIVAFSGGSLLNLAQGKFGRYNENDVRWLAAVGSDFGAVIVAESSPFKTLKDLIAAIKADPTKVVFGAGGTVGSQDWMKAALVAKAAGLDPRSMRFVAFEGGGEASTALQGGHVQVYSGDASEAEEQLKAGAKIRVLAVMSDKRLDGNLAAIPTAKEQGMDVEWPIIRGYYLGPKVSDADYKTWAAAFSKMMASPEFKKIRAERGLFAFDKTGTELDSYVKQRVAYYRKLAGEFGLNVVPAK
jgi:putative tricarboxylic transport membrane protein